MMMKQVSYGVLAGLGALGLLALFALYTNPLLELYLADLRFC